MSSQQLDHLEESSMPPDQVVYTIGQRDRPGRNMACKVKNCMFMTCLLLVAVGAYYSYSKSYPRQGLSEPWPWDDNIDTPQERLHHSNQEENDEYLDEDDDSHEDDNDDDNDGNLGFDESDESIESDTDDAMFWKKTPHGLSEHSTHNSINRLQADHDDDFPVPYNEKLIDLKSEDTNDKYENDVARDQMLQLLNKAPMMNDFKDEAVGTGYGTFKSSNDPMAMARLPPGIPNGLNLNPLENVLQNVPNKPPVPNTFADSASQAIVSNAGKPEELQNSPQLQLSDGNIASPIDQHQTESNLQQQFAIHPQEVEDRFTPTEKHRPRIVLRAEGVRETRDVTSEPPKIPRIIHQSWESAEIPQSFVPWVQSWLVKNPGWEYWFWTNDDVMSLIRKDYPTFSQTFESPSLSVMDRANVMRYFIIHAHGGVYAELDMECLNSMDSWIFSHDCFLAEEAREHSYLVHNKLEGSVINALMACKPNHPFYDVLTHALPEYLIRYRGEPTKASGSFFLDEIYRVFKKHPLPQGLAHYGDVAVIEPDYFIPSYDEKHWSDIDKACNTNILDMPFHVSWLCTLWIRKRVQQNEPYKHSYTDHHWVDMAEVGEGNVLTISITSVLSDVLHYKQQTPGIPSPNQEHLSQMPDSALPLPVPQQVKASVYKDTPETSLLQPLPAQPLSPLSPMLPPLPPPRAQQEQQSTGPLQQSLSMIPSAISPENPPKDTTTQQSRINLPNLLLPQPKTPDTQAIGNEEGNAQANTTGDVSTIPVTSSISHTPEQQQQPGMPPIPPVPLMPLPSSQYPTEGANALIGSQQPSTSNTHGKYDAASILQAALNNIKAHSKTGSPSNLYDIPKYPKTPDTTTTKYPSTNIGVKDGVIADNQFGVDNSLPKAIVQDVVKPAYGSLDPLFGGEHADLGRTHENNDAGANFVPKLDEYQLTEHTNDNSRETPEDTYSAFKHDKYPPIQQPPALPIQNDYQQLQDKFIEPSQNSYQPLQESLDHPVQNEYQPQQDAFAVLNQNKYQSSNDLPRDGSYQQLHDPSTLRSYDNQQHIQNIDHPFQNVIAQPSQKN